MNKQKSIFKLLISTIYLANTYLFQIDHLSDKGNLKSVSIIDNIVIDISSREHDIYELDDAFKDNSEFKENRIYKLTDDVYTLKDEAIYTIDLDFEVNNMKNGLLSIEENLIDDVEEEDESSLYKIKQNNMQDTLKYKDNSLIQFIINKIYNLIFYNSINKAI